MRKSNFITLLVFCVMIIAAIVISTDTAAKAGHGEQPEESAAPESSATPSLPAETPAPYAPDDGTDDAEPADLSDALFIGDSRTVGLMEYAGLSEADFFCGTGMTVFDAYKDRVSVPNVGKVTLSELLSGKSYGKIYLMLGINELGYPFDSVVNKYNDLYELIREQQPDALIFVQAELHVTEKRSESDKYINNSAISRLNAEVEKLADGESSFYLDANPLFDDEGGSLAADKSADDAHLYAKHYAEWGDWLRTETAKLTG